MARQENTSSMELSSEISELYDQLTAVLISPLLVKGNKDEVEESHKAICPLANTIRINNDLILEHIEKIRDLKNNVQVG